ncbi:MAG: hypothetical protein ACR5K5_06420, partial [Wolbachia sp.]
ARKHIPRTDNFIILNMETKGAKPFPKSPIYCFLNHSAERIPIFVVLSNIAGLVISIISIIQKCYYDAKPAP